MSEIAVKGYLDEAEAGFNHRTALEEAARCLLCFDAPCSAACPAGTDPGKFIRSIRFKNAKGAAETIRENNVLGGACAWICPANKLCQSACAKCGIDRSIEIAKLQRYALEQEEAFDMHILKPANRNGKKVALIGAGPASIACASELSSKLGYEPTIFEMEKRAGGVLSYGIPPSRLPQRIVDRDIQAAIDAGVRFEFGHEIKDISELSEFDAIFIGIGLSEPKLPNIPGSELDGVISSNEFLRDARENGGSKISKGKSVIVIGGGDVAMDCAMTAKLSGASNVSVWYRRSIGEAPANLNEILYITKLGIPVTSNMAPKQIFGESKASSIEFTGRDQTSSAKISADLIVFALGMNAVPLQDLGVVSDESGDPINPKIFIGGDIANGGASAVEAVKSGKDAAYKIHSACEKG